MLRFFKVILNHFKLKFCLNSVQSFLITELFIFKLYLDICPFKGCYGKLDLFEWLEVGISFLQISWLIFSQTNLGKENGIPLYKVHESVKFIDLLKLKWINT